MTTAAIAAGLNLPRVPSMWPTKKGKSRIGNFNGTVADVVTAYEERLKAGEKIPAHPDHPDRPFWKKIGESLGIPSSALCSKYLPHRDRIEGFAKLYGLKQPVLAPVAFPFAEFSIVACAHRERELGEGSDSAVGFFVTLIQMRSLRSIRTMTKA